MKRAVKISLFAMFMAVITNVKGAEPKLVLNENSKSVAIYPDESTPVTSILLTDSQHNVIYSETIRENQNSGKILKLGSLPMGNYTLRLEDDLRTTELLIKVNTYSAKVVARRVNTKPVFKQALGKVHLNLLNTDLNVVSIKVTDDQDRVVYTEKLDGMLHIGKVFNFNDAYAGRYTIIVKDGSDVYREKVEVN